MIIDQQTAGNTDDIVLFSMVQIAYGAMATIKQTSKQTSKQTNKRTIKQDERQPKTIIELFYFYQLIIGNRV